jgi:hypothetical protein
MKLDHARPAAAAALEVRGEGPPPSGLSYLLLTSCSTGLNRLSYL